MAITVSRKQITELAKAFDVSGQSYLQKLDMIAKTFGYENQAALMSALNTPAQAAVAENELRAKVRDWRAPHDAEAENDPILEPVDAVVRDNGAEFDIFLNGAEADPYAQGATSLRLEREGSVTRVMVYDGICDAPFVLGIPDGASLRILANDWEHVEPGADAETPAP